MNIPSSSPAGTVGAIRQAIEKTLRKVAPIQCALYKPTLTLTHMGPMVLVARIEGMKQVTSSQVEALETAIDDSRAVSASVILTFGSRR